MENEQVVEAPALDPESSAVQSHLSILQGVIKRMAVNSRFCKVWCVTLVAVTLVLVARTGEPMHALLAGIPTFLFFVLDAYYLAEERSFRNSYSEFVNKLHFGLATSRDLYNVEGKGMGWRLFWQHLRHVPVALFYSLVGTTIAAAWLLIIPTDSMKC